jgi:hypothetical protein
VLNQSIDLAAGHDVQYDWLPALRCKRQCLPTTPA